MTDVTELLKNPPPRPDVSGDPPGPQRACPCPATPSSSTTRPAASRSPASAGHRFPFPVPDGWFIVAQSDELAPGQMRALYLFGRDLVLYGRLG